METPSKIKQVTKAEYVGPYQIQTTSRMSVNFTKVINDYDQSNLILIPINQGKEKLEKDEIENNG